MALPFCHAWRNFCNKFRFIQVKRAWCKWQRSSERRKDSSKKRKIKNLTFLVAMD